MTHLLSLQAMEFDAGLEENDACGVRSTPSIVTCPEMSNPSFVTCVDQFEE